MIAAADVRGKSFGPWYVIFLLLFILASCMEDKDDSGLRPAVSAKGGPSVGIEVGMSLSSFKKLHPGAEPDASGQYRREEILGGMAGEWTYAFRDKKLAWFVFNAYDDRVSPERFDACLDAAKVLISAYEDRYGEPVRRAKGITRFTDPADSQHEGYEVISAEWQTEKGTLGVRFNFIGDRMKYAFLVTVESKRI